jgi:hypothetical protein
VRIAGVIGPRPAVVAALGAALATFAAPAQAAPDAVDLARTGSEALRVIGDRGDSAAYSVAGAGDVNGDGVGDLVIGAPYADANGRRDSGSVFVVYGRRPFDGVDLHFLETRGGGFRVDGAAAGDRLGTSVAGGSDLDGDGHDDLLVGAPRASFFGRARAGVAYVVHGSSRSGATDLANAPAGTVDVIGGRGPGDLTGTSVALPGDVTGDGIPDLLVGAPGADSRVVGYTSANTLTGSAYIVHGRGVRRDGASVDLAARGTADVRQLDGARATERAGTSVAGAGDVDGNGVGDVLIGAPTADRGGRTDSGSAYVVFGGPLADVRNLSGIEEIGRRIDGPGPGARLGQSVAGAGDISGDGLADVVVGAPGAAVGTKRAAGRAYVVHGRRGPGVTDVRGLSNGGYALLGAEGDDRAGRSVASAGDVDGDGVPDVVVGAYRASPNCRGASGSAYVVYGKRGRAPVYLSRLPRSRGYRIDGANPGDRIGWAVANAPGVAAAGPVVVASSATINVPRPYAGAAYLLSRGVRTTPAPRYRTRLPLRVLFRPRGRARDYGGYLSIPVQATDGPLRDVYAAAYTFGGRRVGATRVARLTGRRWLDIRLTERLQARGYTVVVTGSGDPRRYCGPKRREFVLRFR